jgi:hypothetical protein
LLRDLRIAQRIEEAAFAGGLMTIRLAREGRY